MDQTYLLALVIAVLVVLASVGAMRAKPRSRAADGPDEYLAVSTEGMKVCPKCGMGNLWTERKCSACGDALRG